MKALRSEDILKRVNEGEDSEALKIMAMTTFSNEVIRLSETDQISILEALVFVCEHHGVDEDNVKELITPKLLSLIQIESEENHLLKRTTTLPRLF